MLRISLLILFDSNFSELNALIVLIAEKDSESFEVSNPKPT